MKHSSPPPTLKDAIAHMMAHGTDSQKQDIRKARIAFALNGFEAADFETFPADLAVFDEKIKKLTGTMSQLRRLIHAAGITDNTYKQSWRAGRRLIAEFTGAAAAKIARRERNDEWAELERRTGVLVKAGLVNRFVMQQLPAITDECRIRGIAPTNLDADSVATLLNTAESHRRKALRKGLKALDTLRGIPRMMDLLPLQPVIPVEPKRGRRLAALAPHLQESINAWVTHAARTQVEDPRYDHLAVSLSESARSGYSAALSLWVQTLLTNGADLPQGIGLAELFAPDCVDSVLTQWTSNRTRAARTDYGYIVDLSALLARHGLPDEATYLSGLTKLMARLKEGRAADNSMSPKVRRWCEALLRDPGKFALFDRQHIEYFRLAQETLAAARDEKIDLLDLSDPARMACVPDARRSRAKYLLRRARMFGVLATYAAIALEGAPYRRQNILRIRHTGPRKTIHLHLTGCKPHAIVKFPNEELKNGQFLTERGEELEPIAIEKRYEADLGTEILKFYLSEIRPLFPEADRTHCLLPPITRANTNETGIVVGTFNLWLAEGSAEIGLPLTSHNFRHAYCSIAINEGRVSIEDLAKIMGDTVTSLRRYYAWINGAASVASVQTDIARRRAEGVRAMKRSRI